MSKLLLTDNEISGLKRELNFLLWTNDVPPIPHNLQTVTASIETEPGPRINMQCQAHMSIVAALFLRRGFLVTLRSGQAFVLDANPQQAPSKDWENVILKHWWLSVDGYGLVDLSLYAESENPLIYRNKHIGGRWNVVFTDSPEKIVKLRCSRERGCFYLTNNKRPISNSDIEHLLAPTFSPSADQGGPIRYKRIVEHCENFLSDSSKTLTHLSQVEAWKSLHSKP